jgi:excisionase family DNA binding protein
VGVTLPAEHSENRLAYPVADAARALGVSGRTIRRLIAKGTLEARRMPGPVTKATRKSRARPTGTVLVLADSVRAFLDSLPPVAGPAE